MSMKALKFDLNLQRLASISVAIHFWESQDIKDKIFKYFNNFKEKASDEQSDSSMIQIAAWSEIVDEVIRRVKLLIPFEKLRRQITYYVPFIGEKILDFSDFVIHYDLQSNSRDLKKFFFTSIGTIDEMKVFQFVCEKSSVLKPDLRAFLHGGVFISFKNVDGGSEDNEGYFPIQYGESKSYLIPVAKDLLENAGYRVYMTEKRLQMVVFSLNEMSDGGKIFPLTAFCDELFIMCLSVWPYQELIFQMLGIISDYEECDRYYEKLYNLILKNLKDDTRVHNDFKSCMHQEVLQKLLELMPKGVKKACVINEKNSLIWFFEHYDFSTLAVILTDKDLIEIKSDLLDLGNKVFKNLMEDYNFEPINKFLDSGILSDDEIKVFQFRFLEEFAKKKKFETAENVLYWISDGSKIERIRFKKEINTAKICQSLSEENNFNLAAIDEIIIWQFAADPELIRVCKIGLTLLDLFPIEFCKVWSKHCRTSIKTAKEECTEFLEWFLDSRDIHEFKKEKLIEDENFVRIFCDNVHPKDFKTIEDLLKFCCWPKEKTKNFKGKIRDNINWWINLYGIEKDDFRRANVLVKWISENEKDKEKIIGNYINSPKGAELYCKILSGSYPDTVLIILNRWIQPHGDIKKIRENLLARSIYPTTLVMNVFLLLDILERTKRVYPRVVKNLGYSSSFYDHDEDNDDDVDDDGGGSDSCDRKFLIFYWGFIAVNFFFAFSQFSTIIKSVYIIIIAIFGFFVVRFGDSEIFLKIRRAIRMENPLDSLAYFSFLIMFFCMIFEYYSSS